MSPGYSIAWRWAALRRRWYASRLAAIAREPVPSAGGLPATVYFFSGVRDLAEQVASLRSLLRHVGTPREVVVVGDGTHTEVERGVLSSVPCTLRVVPWDRFVRPDLAERVGRYAAVHPLGKKLAVLLSIPVDGTVVFSDSDILYFGGGAELRERLSGGDAAIEFLVDSYPSLDPNLVRESEKQPPVNSGFAILRRVPDWREALARLEGSESEPGHFTEQTVFHLAVRSTGGAALPRARYVFESDDQFRATDRYVGAETVLRHYFSSLRYKMWLRVPMRPGRR